MEEDFGDEAVKHLRGQELGCMQGEQDGGLSRKKEEMITRKW